MAKEKNTKLQVSVGLCPSHRHTFFIRKMWYGTVADMLVSLYQFVHKRKYCF